MPFKKELFLLIKKVWQPPFKLYRHLHFNDIFKVDLPGKNTILIRHFGFKIENEIFWRGIEKGYEKESIKLWMNLCKISKSIIDVGANTGIYALLAKGVNPDAKVVAFEPIPRVYEKMLYNMKLNNFDVDCYKQALSNKNGFVNIYDPMDDHAYTVSINLKKDYKKSSLTQYQVETITLASFIENNDLLEIDLMKIDVETHEPEVLEGMGKYLQLFHPTMLIEILNNEIGKKVEKLIQGCNYLYFNIDENKGIKQVESITRMGCRNYLFCNKETAVKINLIK